MEKHDSASVNKELTQKDRCLIGYQDALIFAGLLATLFLFGAGIFTLWDVNHNRKTIENAIAFIQKTIHSDGLCLTVDTNVKNIFANCPVISNITPYIPVSINPPTDTTTCTPEQSQQNNENIRFNFQSGVHIPGLDFSMILNPNTAGLDQLGGISSHPSLFNQIDISNKFVIEQSGSLMFGDTSTINALFPMNDPSSNFLASETFLNFNLFFIGSFPPGSLSSDRCNLNMGLTSASIYVVLNTNINQVRFCSCVPKQTTVVQEYCTSYLKLVGGISNAH